MITCWRSLTRQRASCSNFEPTPTRFHITRPIISMRTLAMQFLDAPHFPVAFLDDNDLERARRLTVDRKSGALVKDDVEHCRLGCFRRQALRNQTAECTGV